MLTWAFRPTPPVQRALKTTVEKLKAQGHEVVDWRPELHRDLIELLVRSQCYVFLSFSGGLTITTGQVLRSRWRQNSHFDSGTHPRTHPTRTQALRRRKGFRCIRLVEVASQASRARHRVPEACRKCIRFPRHQRRRRCSASRASIAPSRARRLGTKHCLARDDRYREESTSRKPRHSKHHAWPGHRPEKGQTARRSRRWCDEGSSYAFGSHKMSQVLDIRHFLGACRMHSSLRGPACCPHHGEARAAKLSGASRICQFAVGY